MRRLPNGTAVSHMWMVDAKGSPSSPEYLVLKYAIIDPEEDIDPMPYLEAEPEIKAGRINGKVRTFILSYVGLN